ncbi:MAG TPA: hypothetical protein VLV89_10195 [Candidatus Acidoferrum sp.]|nr:hypothetical protein [Candidatus Acidoferrum sp.]
MRKSIWLRHMRAMRVFMVGVLALLFCAAPSFAQRGGRGRGGGEGLGFRFVGPAVGNRISAIAGVPGDINTYYAGGASGGVWKSTDGGNQWLPIFDGQPVQAIGALAVAQTDPNVVWAGTGEAWAIRDSDVAGDGIYKSVDGGKTWTNMGLPDSGRIGRIVVDPRNADNVFVCALGRMTGPQKERGVYRTMDGGKNWELVLTTEEGKTGCSGLSMDPHNSRVLFAGMWQVEMHTYGEYSGGPGSGVYVSRDGGSHWTKIVGRGLPGPPGGKDIGKIDVAVAPSNSNRVYALIQTADQGSLWRSDDGGDIWRVVNWDRALIGRAGYYIRLAVSPADDNEVLVSDSAFLHSTDGGETFRSVPWGGDNHDIWIDPTNADRFVITDDAGLNITTVHGRGFHRVQLPVGQIYHVAVDNQIPYYVYGNMQDDGTMRGISTAGGRGFGAGGDQDWDHPMGGCESGFTIPDPTDPNIVWATCYGDEVTRWDAKTRVARSVSPWYHTLDSPPNDTKYRCHWTPPLAIDPFDHNTVYYGCQVIWRTTNSGQSWSVMSPDLSTQDPKYIQPSGGIVGDNLGQFYGEVVFAIAPSPKQKGLIWAGTNDGQVWYTKDAGANWTNVSKNITGMPAWGTITCISPSNFDAGTAYIAVDLHLMDNRDPFIYKTNDFGATWTQISSNLPAKHPLAYVRSIAEDPNKKGLLFAGTGNGFYYSLDDGGHWTNLQAGLPRSPVSWITIQKQYHDVVVSTYGRGIYIMDDVTPLEQMPATGQPDASVVFAPRPVYRSSRGGRGTIDYWLKDASQGPVQIQILDSGGTMIRELRGGGRAGLNRAGWDLHYEGPHLIALRTTPPENPHIWEEPRFRGLDSRPITHWGMSPNIGGPLAAPGKYTIKVTANGQTYTQTLDVMRDPKVQTSDADFAASVKMQLRIRDDINKSSDIVNQIEWMRRQLDDVERMLRTQTGKADLLKSVMDMDTKMQTVEYKILNKALTTSDDKYFIEAYKVYFNLLWLNGEVGPGAGDVAGGEDFGPTDTERNLLDMIEKDLTAATADYRNLMDKDLPAFNKSLLEHGVSPLVATIPPPAEPKDAVAGTSDN